MASKAYAEYLRENGATEDEIKVLDVPAARKVYDAQLKAAADAAADAADKAARLSAYDKWYNEVAEPTAAQIKAERDVARAEADAERARSKSLQEAGLIKLEEKKEAPKSDSAALFDPKAHNLVTSDMVRALADQEGDAIAIMADIAEEHRELTGQRINARELRAEAKKQGKTLEQVWLDKYQIPAKREAKIAADKKAYEDKLREEGRAEERSKQGNPLTRPAVASSNPWTSSAAKKTGTDGSNVLPWHGSQSERQNERVNRALRNMTEKGIL